AKMNSLVDEDIIRALYEASTAGVRVRLNVRGICCLRPGVRGLSERIEVVSIVDRFLEHSRIFHFRNGGDDEVYLASADWMPRNLYERVEVMFPVKDPMLRNRVRNEILDAYLADTVKARVLRKDGSYVRAWQAAGKRKPPVPGFSAQDFLVALAEGKQTIQAIPTMPEVRPRRIAPRKERRAS